MRVVRVSAEELRRRFNHAACVERAARGELLVRVLREAHPSPPRSREPRCTRSQLLGYYDRITGQLVALAHQYRRRDGSIGGKGRPDPKQLVEGDTIYRIWI